MAINRFGTPFFSYRCLIFYFTNRYMLSDIFDPAFLRPGRIDRKIEFPPVSILHIHSWKVKIYFLSIKIIGSILQLFSDVITAWRQFTCTMTEKMGQCSGAEVRGICTLYGKHVRSPSTKTTHDARGKNISKTCIVRSTLTAWGFRVCCCQGASPCLISFVVIIYIYIYYRTGIPQSTSRFHRPAFVSFVLIIIHFSMLYGSLAYLSLYSEYSTLSVGNWLALQFYRGY